MEVIQHNGFVQSSNQFPETKFLDNIDAIQNPVSVSVSNEQSAEEKVQIYLRTNDRKAAKISCSTPTIVQKIQQIVFSKFGIEQKDQVLHLNGQCISDLEVFHGEKIFLKGNEIIHVLNKQESVSKDDDIRIMIKVISLKKLSDWQQTIIKGSDCVRSLKSFVEKNSDLDDISYEHLNLQFLESGRVLQQDKTFAQCQLGTFSEVICILSQNKIKTQTNFSNPKVLQSIYREKKQHSQLPQINPKTQIQVKLESNVNEPQHTNQNDQSQINNANDFVLDQPNLPKKLKYSFSSQSLQEKAPERHQGCYTSQGHYNPWLKDRDQPKQQSHEAKFSFKKKKTSTEDFEEDSTLLSKITVHKSKQEVERILNQNSLTKNEDKQSIVSSSSEDEEKYPSKSYTQSPQQFRVYKPSPLIHQRRLLFDEKVKIRNQMQKLFETISDDNQRNQVEECQQETQQSPTRVSDKESLSASAVSKKDLETGNSQKAKLRASLSFGIKTPISQMGERAKNKKIPSQRYAQYERDKDKEGSD